MTFLRRLSLVALFAALMITPSFAEQDKAGSGSGSKPSSAGSGSASGSPKASAGSGSASTGSGSKAASGSAGSGSASGSKPSTGAGVDLRWKFEKDKPFYQQMTTNTDQTLTITGTPIKQKQSQTFVYSWTLLEKKDNGDMVLRQKIEAVKMEINIGTQSIKYDSTTESGASNPLSDFLKNLVGTEFTVTLDKGYKVQKIEGKDKLVQKLGASSKPTEELLNSILNDESMKELADPTFSALPNKPEEKGAKWERKSKFDMGPIGSYENNYVYTFEGEESNKKDKIGITGTVKYMKPNEKTGGLPFKIKDANIAVSEIKGQALYNPETGWIENLTTSMNIKGDLTVEISGQTTKVDLEQTQQTLVTTSKDNPASKSSGTPSAGSGSGSSSK